MAIVGAGITSWQQAMRDMADWIAGGWSSGHAEAIAMVHLDDSRDTNEHHASVLGITRQALAARLRGSGFAAMALGRSAFQARAFGPEAHPICL
jgi:hypothetical protein